jgi:hypothetical protein
MPDEQQQPNPIGPNGVMPAIVPITWSWTPTRTNDGQPFVILTAATFVGSAIYFIPAHEARQHGARTVQAANDALKLPGGLVEASMEDVQRLNNGKKRGPR